MHSAFVLPLVLLLGGCESYGDLTSDAFDPGGASQSRFTLDSADCAARANIARDYDVRIIAGTHAESHEAFNRAYAACMTGEGYGRRDWSPKIPLPYKIDPMPG
ncbi:MAG TPA: hypothetical protein VJ476_07695 [Rhizomicrobium sp.]|nr:hypothetical protein [Rhizomicrobium sp.]